MKTRSLLWLTARWCCDNGAAKSNERRNAPEAECFIHTTSPPSTLSRDVSLRGCTTLRLQNRVMMEHWVAYRVMM